LCAQELPSSFLTTEITIAAYEVKSSQDLLPRGGHEGSVLRKSLGPAASVEFWGLGHNFTDKGKPILSYIAYVFNFLKI
jgi:hypothetical protein